MRGVGGRWASDAVSAAHGKGAGNVDIISNDVTPVPVGIPIMPRVTASVYVSPPNMVEFLFLLEIDLITPGAFSYTMHRKKFVRGSKNLGKSKRW